jgi:putative transposase
MPYDPTEHHRRSIRLPGYDYAAAGAYFVTICVRSGECLLGEVVDSEMQLNEWGQIVAEAWQWLGEQYAYVSLDASVIMPNHIHGILVIREHAPLYDTVGGGSGAAPTMPSTPAPPSTATRTQVKRKPLGRLVGAFKTVSTKQINRRRDVPGVPFWQRNYWEHIVRNDRALNRIRRYIASNPARWAEDRLHPDAPRSRFSQR